MPNITVSAVSFDLNPVANTYLLNSAASTLAANLARSSGSPARTTAGLTCTTATFHYFINDALSAILGAVNGTLVIDWQLTSDVSVDLFDIGTADHNRVCIFRQQGTSTVNYYWAKNNYQSSGDGQIGSGFALNTTYRSAFSIRDGSMRFCHNGGSVITDNNAPPTKSGASLFGNPFFTGWNGAGRVRRVFFIPDDLSDADLQTIATQGNDYAISAPPPDEATLVLPAGAKVFYSAKRANGYHGPFARVWRASDNTEMDVAWNGDVPDYASVITWANGSEVRFRRVYNQVAGGAHAQQTNNAFCPIFSVAQLKNDMVPICLDGDLVAASHYLTYSLNANRNDLTVFEAITPLVSLAPTTYWEFDNGSDIYLNLFQDPGIGSGMCMFDGSGVQSSASKPRAQLSTIGYTNNGTTAKLWNREGTIALVSHGAQAMTAGTIGRSLAGDYACGRANLFCHYVGTALNDTAAAAFRDLLNAEFSVPTTFTKRLLIGSDSLIEGYDCTENQNIVYAMDLDDDIEVFNLGIYGQQLSQEAANSSNFLDLYDAGKPCVALIDGGSNDFVGSGVSAASVYATATSWISTLKGAGFKTGIMSIIARADLSEDTRTSYNAMLRTDKAGADVLMDAGADVYLGDYAQTGQTIWFSDGAHLMNVGYARLGTEYFRPAADALFSTTVLPSVNISAEQTVAAPTQVASAGSSVSLLAAQPIPPPNQIASVGSSVAAAAVQAVPAPMQTATASPVVAVSADQNVSAPSQNASVRAIANVEAHQAVAAPTQSGSIKSVASLSGSQSIAPPSQAATSSSTVVVSADQSIAPPSQTASVSVTGVANVAAHQTIKAPTQIGDIRSVVGLLGSQLVSPPSQDASARTSVVLSADQSVAAPSQAGSVKSLVSISASQLIAAPTQVASIVADDTVITDENGDPITDENGDPITGGQPTAVQISGSQVVAVPTQTASASAIISAAADQVVSAPSQTASISVIEPDTANVEAHQTVVAPSQVADARTIAKVSAAQAVLPPTQSSDLTVAIHISGAQLVHAPTNYGRVQTVPSTRPAPQNVAVLLVGP